MALVKESSEVPEIIKGSKRPFLWLPSYFIPCGIPYAIVMTMAGIMYKNLGVSNIEIAFYTSCLYLPWTIKPLWSPIVQMYGTNKMWVVSMQSLLAILFGVMAFTLPTAHFFQNTLAVFWLIAFASSTHDISGDGLYLSALSKDQQAFYVGWISTLYRIAMLIGQGGIVMAAGALLNYYSVTFSYSILFICLGIFFILVALYNYFVLPVPASLTPSAGSHNEKLTYFYKEFKDIIYSFFRRKEIVIYLSFILFYRFAEAQLSKISSLFMLDPISSGGLGLSTARVGIIYGTFGVVALTLGGILSGYLIYKNGLKKWIWIMVCSINLPNVVYVYLSFAQPGSFITISLCVIVEMFGYGFGFSAFMLCLMKISDGKYKTAHYSICTAFMALGMMIPGMFSGYIQSILSYKGFYIWVMICTIPSFFVTRFLPLGKDEFKKSKK